MNTIKITFVFALLAWVSAYSQTPSAYSAFNFGILNEFKSTRNIGFGSSAVTLDDADFMNQDNPAALSKIELTKLEAFVTANGLSTSSGSGLKRYYAYGELGGFSVGFPVYHPYGIGMMLGLSPYSNARYDMKSTDNSNPNFNTATNEVSLRGGLNDLHASFSVVVPYDIKLGIKFHHLFGSTQFSTKMSFGNSAFTSAEYTTQYEDHGSLITLGLITPDFQFAGLENIRFGLSIDTKTMIKTDTFLVRVASAVNDTLSNGNGETNLPMKIIAGASFTFSPGYKGILEYALQDWASATGLRVAGLYTRSYHRFSAGVEYRPLKDQMTDFNKTAYRGGISYEQLPISILGTGINQLAVSLGASFPVSYQNHIDIGATYGIRGTTDNNLIKENFYRFSVGISLGELWFMQQER